MSVGGLISSLTSSLSRRGSVITMREYDSFESALQASDSYEDPRLVDVVFQKTKIYRQRLVGNTPKVVNSRQLVQNLFVLEHLPYSRRISVLELGGACGASYFEMRQLLSERIDQWSIVETAAMADAGRSLNDDESLSFHSDLPSAVSILNARDLAFAQGVLQYASDPLQMLAELFSLGFDHVYVSRTVVLADSSENSVSRIFTQQDTQLSAHGPGSFPPGIVDATSSQPIVLVNRDLIFATIPETYEVEFLFEESDKRTIRVGDRERELIDIGFLAKKINLQD